MDLNKLSTLSVIKRTIVKKDSIHKLKNISIKKAPHAIACEVLFYNNTYYTIINNNRYPIEITNEDYLNASYGYSTPNNPNWDYYTLRKLNCNEASIETIKEYWQLVIPKTKTYVNINNGIAKLCMERVNIKLERIFNKLGAKYYANRKN